MTSARSVSPRWWPSQWPLPLQLLVLITLGTGIGMACGGLPWAAQGLLVAASFAVTLRGPILRRIRKLLPQVEERSVQAMPAVDLATLRRALQQCDIDCVEIDGSRVRDQQGLAVELDRVLGPFQYPTEPSAKILAHLAHESRGRGRRVVLWTHAATMRAADPAAFAAFVAAWAEAMPKRGLRRSLWLDLSAEAIDALVR
jgi:hypothetical protein